uniref:non-specific serine/threonine protein kinase n=1 Tax=Arion vulgaris TaxID=1028688 RepID=A0A0B7AW07_9EUPU
MIRKENDRPVAGGRRPLLVTFVGNNRQMLNEIRDSLSYLRKNDLEGYNDFSNLHLKPELSQSTPNLLEKSAGSKMTRRDNQHHKALAEIRDSLRPYQNASNGPISGTGGGSGGGSSDNSSSASSTSSHAASEAESNFEKVQKIMQYGFDEDIAVRALQLSGNHSVTAALRLLIFIMEEKIGSGIKCAGLAGYGLNQRPNFGPSSPVASETNSVRSDSPSQNSSQQRQLLVNGLQTPPPLPPRVPIPTQANHTSQNQTLPISLDGPGVPKVGNGASNQALPSQNLVMLPTLNQNKGQATSMTQPRMIVHGHNHVVPQGHVQQMIQRMSPGQAYYHLQQKQQQQQQQVPPQVNGGVRTVAQRGISPVTAIGPQQPLIMSANSNGSTTSPSPLLPPQLQNIMLGTQLNPSQNGPSPTSNCSSAMTQGHTQAPPPPYSQARLQVATATGLYGGAVGGVLPSAHRDHLQQQDFYCVSPMLEAQLMSVPAEPSQVIQSVAPTAVSATRMAMGLNHMPVIMPSVHSKEVTKPMPQTATAPVGTPNINLNGGLPPNHIAQVQTHISNSSPMPNHQQLKQHHQQTLTSGQLPHVVPSSRRDIQIPNTHCNHNGPQIVRNGGNYTMEQLAAVGAGQPTVQTLNHHLQSTFSHNHLQALKMQNNTMYQQFTVDTSMSTVRSDSPISLTTNQSPMSMLSTTSSPSSDVPDKPPPPYPGRGMVGLNMGLSPKLNPPIIPPRVPLKDKPPPPPPPLTDQEFLPQPGTQSQMIHFQPSHLSASFPQATNSTTSPLMGNGLSVQTSSPISENVAVSLHPVTSNPQLHMDSGNTGNTQVGGCPQLIIPQNTSSTTPSETDETDTDTSSIGQCHNTSTTKCSTSTAQETHRCMSPLPERKSEARERDRLRCDTKVQIYSSQAFKFYMEQHVENVLKSHTQRMNRRLQLEKEMAKVNLSEEAARQMRKMLYQKESNYIRLKRAKMDCAMFEKIQTLGVGAFGEVSLVRKKDVGSLYAMKTLKKSNVIKRNQVAHVKAERDILAEADNEWVVKLYYSFQDQDHLYFVMDYVPGGDLMGLLIRKEILDEHLAQFYIAELVLAIESVHRMGFIHRDIKPDNILIDKDGHIKLTDFGLCTGFRWTHNSKYYQKDGAHARQDSMEVGSQLDDQCHGEILKPLEQRRQREQKRCLAHSLVGTPNYIAPEVLLRLGYTKACDWWSVGVILYEMVIGQPPFYASSPAETQYKVINWKETLTIRHCTNITPVTTDLIIQLLQGPENRLGRNGATEVKEHKFFTGTNFEGLRRIPAPLKPTIKFLTDTSNFDPVDPDKLRTNDSEGSKKVDSKLENGKHPEHAFFEFTFRRFFDDGGHPCSVPLQPDQEANSPVYV